MAATQALAAKRIVIGSIYNLICWVWCVASLNPSLELWVVFCASQTAFAIIVNASIDDLTIHVG
jgi:hypothetical protein